MVRETAHKLSSCARVKFSILIGMDGAFRSHPHRNRSLDSIEIAEHDEHFVSPIIRTFPALARHGIEKVCHQPIGVNVRFVLLFDDASSLKLSKTFQFVARKTAQEFDYRLSVDRSCRTKKSTEKRRARGYSGQN